MTKHSALTNSNDLHYAKIRTFTGDPNSITPNFLDQILTATDTNKIYRAVGETLGALVELSAPTQNQGAAETQWTFLNESIDLEIGKKYIKTQTGDIFCRLPTTASIGDSIRLKVLRDCDFLHLNSAGALISLQTNNLQTSPFNENSRQQYIYPVSDVPWTCELTYIQGNTWVDLSGSLAYRRYPPEVRGCTDSTASNYNPLANEDDGNCTYAGSRVGCMDTSALNFDPLATESDESLCIYP